MDILLEKKKGLRKKHIPYALGVLLLGFIIWLAVSDHSSTLVIDGRTIAIGTVEQRLFNDYVRVNGQVQPISTIQVTPLEAGVVEVRNVEEGTVVHKGDVILTLSNQNLSLAVLESENQLADKQNVLRNAEIQMAQARLDLQRERLTTGLDIQRKKRQYQQKEKLFNEKLIAKEDYLQAKEDYELAEHSRELVMQRQEQDSLSRVVQLAYLKENVENVHQNMALIRQRVENLKLKAPIDGELGQLGVELGQSIGAGMKIGQINDMSDYKIQAMIDEHYIDKVRAGLDARFERKGTEYALKVKKVYPEVQGGQFKTDFHFEGERPDNIRSGQTYYINLELGQPVEALLIPRAAFYQKTGGNWIFVLSADGKKAFKRNIKIGRQNPQHYEVLEGLDPGEKVIVSSYETYGENEVLILK